MLKHVFPLKSEIYLDHIAITRLWKYYTSLRLSFSQYNQLSGATRIRRTSLLEFSSLFLCLSTHQHNVFPPFLVLISLNEVCNKTENLSIAWKHRIDKTSERKLLKNFLLELVIIGLFLSSTGQNFFSSAN